MHSLYKPITFEVVGCSSSLVDAEECVDLPEDLTVEIASLISDENFWQTKLTYPLRKERVGYVVGGDVL